MILGILTGADNPALRRRSEEVTDAADEELQRLIADMRQTLSSSENGIGLAAPQVGRNVRLFVVSPEVAEELGGHTVFINPVVTRRSRKTYEEEEGCLSIPGKWEVVERPQKATVKATDEHGRSFKVTGKGLAARLLQHEADHLDGKLYVDYLR